MALPLVVLLSHLWLFFIRFLHRHLAVPAIKRMFTEILPHPSTRSHLLVHFPSVNEHLTYPSLSPAPDVHLYIYNPLRFCLRMVFHSRRIALAESFMAGEWHATPSTKHLLQLLISGRGNARRAPSNSFMCSLRRLPALFDKWTHHQRSNTPDGSRRNVSDHYDLGNDLFRLFLDDTMTYSCAIFQTLTSIQHQLQTGVDLSSHSLLREAQLRKYDRAVGMLELKEGERVLEVGCGWGGCALRAMETHASMGIHWTGLTLSHEQLQWARANTEGVGMEQIQLELKDYRAEKRTYDKIIAIEMIEAVGHEYLPAFFQCMRRCLPMSGGGRLMLQAIVCPDSEYGRYRESGHDFIRKHIFPGGHMPSVATLRAASAPYGFRITRLDSIGEHYSPTLDIWGAAWKRNKKKIMGDRSPSFYRKWEYYFALCSSLFAEKRIDVVQILMEA